MNDTSPAAEQRHLDSIVGRWSTSGRTVATSDSPAIEVRGTDTYEWMDGGFFLIHRVDVQMGDARVKAIEMIGPYDAATQRYPMRSFDNEGNFATMQAQRDADGTLHLVGDTQRATLRVAPDRKSMDARWEQRNGGKWQHWMDLHFTPADD